jgi:hypothetical protein
MQTLLEEVKLLVNVKFQNLIGPLILWEGASGLLKHRQDIFLSLCDVSLNFFLREYPLHCAKIMNSICTLDCSKDRVLGKRIVIVLGTIMLILVHQFRQPFNTKREVSTSKQISITLG